MRLKLKNIGMLKEAELTLHKLCVIAGENDNGKSTVGKIVFCILKAVNRYKEDLRESKEYTIAEKLQEIYFLLRSETRAANEGILDQLGILRSISLRSKVNEESWTSICESIEGILEHQEVSAKATEQVQQIVQDITELIVEPEDAKKQIESAFGKIFAAEFDASLLLQGASEGQIQLFDNDIELLNLKIDRESGVSLLSNVEPIELKDATFIDSPLILNNHDLLIRSQTLLDMDRRRIGYSGMAYTTLHTKDLFDKLRQPVMPDDLLSSAKAKQQQDKLAAIVGGTISYEKGARDFVFTREQQNVSIKNTASGIKVFGLLQILLANDFVSEKTMLIFDEPENHLHPKWQLKLADLLVEMVSNGIYVLVSSHSPYMIEALKRFSERAGLADQSGFFLAEQQSIRDEDRLEDIFQVLSEPFEIFRQMDAEDIRDE